MIGSRCIIELKTATDAGARGGSGGGGPAERAASRVKLSDQELVHDLSNSLSAIVMLASCVMDAVPQNSDAMEDLEMVRSTAREGLEACHRLREVLAEAVRNSEQERPASTTEDAAEPHELSERIDINAVVQQSISMLRSIAGDGVEMRFELETGVPRVVARASELRQLLINLVLNAAQSFEANDRRIIVRTERVEGSRVVDDPDMVLAGRLLDQPYVCLLVIDTGSGISPAARERIFRSRFTTKPKGHGDGLASVRKTLEAYGGTVMIGGSPGQGTTVRAFLPVRTGASAD